MSYGDNESKDIMKAFFSGKIRIDETSSKYKNVELGHGIGIGHTHGSYSQYIKQLSERSKEGNGIIYLGKDITTDNDVMSIVDATEKFDTGDTPKLLITFYNVLNGMTVKAIWKDDSNNTILEQYYQIPLPYSMNYSWWDTYSTYFIGPDNLEEGDYKVEISSIKNVKNGQLDELSCTIEFSVS
jgi:hypothetical protein